MKIFDCVLISVAVGLTLFTLYTLASGQVEPYVAPPPDHPGDFQWIVVHESDACPRLDRGKPIVTHFIVTEGGAVLPTHHWRRRKAAVHTANRRMNEASVAVLIERGPYVRADRQKRAFKTLLADLMSRFSIPAERVVPHAKVDACECGKNAKW